MNVINKGMRMHSFYITIHRIFHKSSKSVHDTNTINEYNAIVSYENDINKGGNLCIFLKMHLEMCKDR